MPSVDGGTEEQTLNSPVSFDIVSAIEDGKVLQPPAVVLVADGQKEHAIEGCAINDPAPRAATNSRSLLRIDRRPPENILPEEVSLETNASIILAAEAFESAKSGRPCERCGQQFLIKIESSMLSSPTSTQPPPFLLPPFYNLVLNIFCIFARRISLERGRSKSPPREKFQQYTIKQQRRKGTTRKIIRGRGERRNEK
jgi:hypothetical protein